MSVRNKKPNLAFILTNSLENFFHHRPYITSIFEELQFRAILYSDRSQRVHNIVSCNSFIYCIKYNVFLAVVPILIMSLRFFLLRPKVVFAANLQNYFIVSVIRTTLPFLFSRTTMFILVPGLGRLFSISENSKVQNRIMKRVVLFFLRRGLQGSSFIFETSASRSEWIRLGLCNPDDSYVVRGR